MNVSQEIELFSKQDDKPILLWLLDRYRLQSRWELLAKCTFQRYGVASYAVNRIWQPTIEGVILYRNRKEIEA